MHLRPVLALAVAAAVAAVAALLTLGASPAPSAPRGLPGTGITLDAAQAVRRRCEARLLPAGAEGAARTAYVAPRSGALTVRTDGPAGSDWDVAVFDAPTQKRLAASSTFGADETVTAFLAAGDNVVVQACRRTGGAESLAVGLDFFATSASAKAAEPARLVKVAARTPADVQRLSELGVDVTHQADEDGVEVILYSAAERAKLRDAGFDFTTRVADLGAADSESQRQDARAPRAAAGRALPSGRTTYRVSADYASDLKALADANPSLVRKVTLPVRSLENCPIEGVEIAADAGREGDGRPIFLLAGLTHAREWPGGENAIEFAIDAVKTYAAGTDPRITAMLQRTRIVVLPILNPDGFMVSRDQAGAAFAAGDDRPDLTTIPEALGDAGAYKRKNCRAPTPEEQGTPCASRAPFGVDLNRAYGAFWGGPGTSTDMTTQQYRGPAPFSEPEAEAVRQFGAANQIQVYITNHTFTDGRFLRQPGFKVRNDPVPDVTPDEAIFTKLGDKMASATGYVSELGYATLGNITGPSDDFLYFTQGTIGYTPELRGGNFHTSYADAVVGEYEGEGTKAGRGLREAYIAAAEQAADEADHVVLRGTAPPGRTLRLTRVARTQTFEDEDGDGVKDKAAVFTDEPIDTTIVVPASGRYEWHVNPSTQPLAAARSDDFTFTCAEGAAVRETHTPTVDRGQVAEQDFTCTEGVAPAREAEPFTPVRSTPTGNGPPQPSTPSSTPSSTPAQKPWAKPTPARKVRVAVRRPNASAGRTRRRGFSAYVSIRDGTLRSVRLRVVDARGRTVASASRTRLTRSARVRFKLRRRPRVGKVRVILTARDAAGATVRVTRSFRFRS